MTDFITADEIAATIRQHDGSNSMGAGALGEVIADKVNARLALYVDKADRLAGRLGNATVAVQNGEPEAVILGMMRGELKWDADSPVRA